jgi:hypothetical protein
MKKPITAFAALALLALAGCDSPAFHQNWPGGSDYRPHAGDWRDADRWDQRADARRDWEDRAEARREWCRWHPDACYR